ncbi:hypothetical protein [Pseudothermotoga thermarum]|uniref:Uncharacterized protein n=1 Tax=Pseudothermotoga thermarum DSM 5069 TaxID=688269 RepID=F7YY26_9THEM|nr:hypothetical protein [Pseudothermotoga thermarum]AEH50836.1 hypothetical protein Theth_0751 [Pseudothermotoga thermarum DSM 5069]
MKFLPYFILLLGIVIATIGFLFVLAYVLLNHLMPFVKDLLNVSVTSSKWFLLVAVFTLLTGLSLSFYTLRKSSDQSGLLFLLTCIASITLSTIVQIWRTIVTGLAWIGIELLGNYANIGVVKIFSMIFLLFNIVLLTFCYVLIREERRNK